MASFQQLKETRTVALALLSIFSVYIACAPNFQWSTSYDETPYSADFLQEWVGARMVLAGEVEWLYTNQFIQNQHESEYVGFSWKPSAYFPAVYPPPHYLLFSPVGLLPYRWAGILWLFLQMVFVYMSWLATRSLHDRFGIDSAHSHLGRSVWLALLLFPPLLFSITLGQKSAMWMMMIAVAMSLYASGKEVKAGIAFGFLSIKPTLFCLVPLIALKQRRWRFLGGCLISTSLIWGLTLCLMPWNAWSGFLDVARGAGSFAENGGYRADWSCNLLTLAYSLPTDLVGWGKLAICSPLVIYVLYSVFFHCQKLERAEGWLLILVCTALLSPHFYYYDLCILLPPLLWHWAKKPNESIAVYVLLAVGCSVSATVFEQLRTPILPIALLGVVTAFTLRTKMQSAIVSPSTGIKPTTLLPN